MANFANKGVFDPGLRQRLDGARAEATASLSRDEVAEIVWSVVASMEGDLSAMDLKAYMELEELANYIKDARQEIAAIRPDEIRDQHIPTATDELDAVVGATEAATNTIMDACDAIGAIAGRVDSESGAALTDAITRVFEACNFQDITGQRITKVVRALKHIETKIDALLDVFGEEIKRVRKDSASEPMPMPEPEPEPELNSAGEVLHGPALPGNAIDQDEIDRLLASFG